MAGLSTEGMQTRIIVLRHPELFAWAGIFSGGLVIHDDDSMGEKTDMSDRRKRWK